MNQQTVQRTPPAVNRRLLFLAGIILGIVFLAIGVIYFITPAASLPHFFPGYSLALGNHIHYKHALASVLLGLGAFVLAWFNSGSASAQQK